MRPKSIILALCAFLGVTVGAWSESASSPQEEFLNVYAGFQKGERQEASADERGALQTYKDALHRIERIASQWPDWNPTVVEYRKRRLSEAVARLSGKVGSETTRGNGQASGPDEPMLPTGDNEPTLPENPIAPEVNPPNGGRPARHPRNEAPAPAATGDPMQALNILINDLKKKNAAQEAELSKLRQESASTAAQLTQAKAAAKAAADKVAIVQDRADAAEERLDAAKKKGSTDAQAIKTLQADRDKARRDLRESQIEGEAANEVREQVIARLNMTQKRASDLQSERDKATELSAGAQKQIAEAEKKADAQVADAREKMNQAYKERDGLKTQLASITKERDAALSQVQKYKESQKQMDKLLSDNQRLVTELADAQKQITQLKTDDAQKDAAIADLKKEVGSAKQQLAETKKQSAEYQTHMGELQAKLDLTAKDLATMKTDNVTGATERKKMTEENELLRNIVMREMKEQARRDQTRKLVLDQMSKMDVKSTELLRNINVLGQPVVKLSPKERALFKKPQVEISENEISLAAPKSDEAENPATTAAPPPEAPPIADARLMPPPPPVVPTPTVAEVAPSAPPLPASTAKTAATPAASSGKNHPSTVRAAPPATPAPAPVAKPPGPTPSSELASNESAPETIAVASLNESSRRGKSAMTADEPTKKNKDDGGDPAVGAKEASATSATSAKAGSPELSAVLTQAKENFDKGNLREAEKLYEKVLAQDPNNLSARSNLGVVQFRGGKLKLAEESFKKAIASAPEDAFSHCTLGIVYYSQGRYDDAVNELTKALAINPKNPIAHNYLGITASQKGWQEAAQKELETASALDPSYADAQFNLAVIFGTQQPPNKESARKFYHRAVELGAAPDTSLEQLIK